MGIVAGVVSLVAFILYAISLKYESESSRPSKSTWWILTVVGVMILVSYWESGARSTIWIPITYVIGPLVIGILSIRFGETKEERKARSMWQTPDPYCVIGAIFGVTIWWLTESAVLALVVFVGTDLAGIFPTIWKSFLRPWTEQPLPWAFSVVASMINLLAVEQWSLSVEVWLYPWYMLFGNALILAPLLWHKYRKPLPT